MNLSKENIQFIDNYLDNSDIIYADIRMEILDHVASGIEDRIAKGDDRDFYYIFKDYMVEDKARLLDDNRSFIKSTDQKIAKLLIKNLFSILGLVVFGILFFSFYVAFKNFDYNVFKYVLFAVPIFTSVSFGLIYFIALRVYKLDRYSVIERISFPFIIIFHVFTSFNNILKPLAGNNSTLIMITIVSLCLTLLILLFKITIDLSKTYQTRFKNLV